ncbi:hypothetical protein [Bacillus salipaludis]|uniref:hypothetical protein n=1 Tax=Bacillus salipaludis TaxID=2547811 RepID=UPI002E206114|nr:hypothetical protein [Bacillus salipaludis]
MLQFSNGTHKFTFTTSLLLKQKIENVKFEYGDTVQIVHTLETYDTMKFYHKFLKAQFSNRLVEGKSNHYKLTNEDVPYLKEEKFSSNAMEWFEGPLQVKIIPGANPRLNYEEAYQHEQNHLQGISRIRTY